MSAVRGPGGATHAGGDQPSGCPLRGVSSTIHPRLSFSHDDGRFVLRPWPSPPFPNLPMETKEAHPRARNQSKPLPPPPRPRCQVSESRNMVRQSRLAEVRR
ncbi:hypothetical protein VFPFJ_08772 [Purpureocillium lilacinum]|nr:hypothetical protein VFPFJ_08772 [Purpureocillium lilacinum]OAQ74856.1 hypothetical protein VFPBJ_10151 [Purpureocillium lilacinum]OAQ82969.1 hypothetical protein VFPFJ_08772 [Purpureocillium lilacinum]